MTRIASLAAIVAFAGSATAQFAPGSLLFTSDNRTGGSDTVNALDYSSLNIDQLLAFPAGDQTTSAFGGLTPGPNGEFYIANSPNPTVVPSTAELFRIDGLFSGAPSTSLFSDNDAFQRSGGVTYDPFTDSLLVLNNPGSDPALPTDTEGMLSFDRATGAYDGLVVGQNLGDPAPRIQATGGGIVPTGRNAGEYYFGSLNGGVAVDPSQGTGGRANASAIARTQLNDPANPLDDTTDILIDLSPSVTGQSEFISLIRGMDVLPSGNLIIADLNSASIWEIAIDGNGDYAGITRLLDLEPEGRVPGDIIYNPFTNKINYVEFTDGDPFTMDIVEINLDGTGAVDLATGLTGVGSLIAIPAPASAALLGLGGLAAVRRRR